MIRITKNFGKNFKFGKQMDCYECFNDNSRKTYMLYRYSGCVCEPLENIGGEGDVGILVCDHFQLVFDWNRVHGVGNTIDLSKLSGISEFGHGSHRSETALNNTGTYNPFIPPGGNWEVIFLNPYGSILMTHVSPISLRQRIFGKWEGPDDNKGKSIIYVAKGTTFDSQSSGFHGILVQGAKYAKSPQKYVTGTNKYTGKLKDLALSEFTDDDYMGETSKGKNNSALYCMMVAVMRCAGLGLIRITGGELGDLGTFRLSGLMKSIVELNLPRRIMIRSCRGFKDHGAQENEWYAEYNVGPTVMESLGVLSLEQGKMPDRFSAKDAIYDTLTIQKGQMIRTNSGGFPDKQGFNKASSQQTPFRQGFDTVNKHLLKEHIPVQTLNEHLKGKLAIPNNQDLSLGKLQSRQYVQGSVDYQRQATALNRPMGYLSKNPTRNEFDYNIGLPSITQTLNNGGIELEPLFFGDQFKQRDLSYKSISGVKASDFGSNSGGNYIDEFGKQIQPYYDSLCIQLKEMSKKKNFNEEYQEFIAYIMEFLHPNYVNTSYKRILQLRANFTAISNKCDRFFQKQISNIIMECTHDQISLKSLMDRLNRPQSKYHN